MQEISEDFTFSNRRNDGDKVEVDELEMKKIVTDENERKVDTRKVFPAESDEEIQDAVKVSNKITDGNMNVENMPLLLQ